MRILILGAGGVGGYLGGRLLEAGAKVSFLVRGTRATQLQRDGLIVKSSLGDIAARAPVLTPGAIAPAADLIIVACKSYSLDSAFAAIAPLADAATRVLLVLNGIRHLDVARAHFAPDRIAGGVINGAFDLTPDGTVLHLSPFLTLIAGMPFAPPDPVLSQAVAALASAKVDARESRNILDDLWGKFAFIATLAGVTCLMRASIGSILDTPHGEALIGQLFDENFAIAAAEGAKPPAASIERYRSILAERGSPLTASMLRDIQAHRPTEGEHILGDLLRRAHRHGLDVPLLRVAATHVRAYEVSRGAAC